ncbi:hypothetical protein DYBT9275_05785 [Dyadobacter sp. CECT 9275]|uniref:DUF3037 domain-containing protein n=1 Tax=Dyadobacter helix TaxID=2822344 RepID=A0A916JJP7_9BACT|nr:DUF3037 domain-containing protein [Dyadobacter sp. CECT 9275]CAG5017500.1 hypothetical protein DYBT9275_05785 [Dyadobacter sp. CECT 9275]
MQERHLFEYAVIRLVPIVEREEFLNVGVILYCASQRFLKASVDVNEKRIRAFSAGCDPEEIKVYLASLQKICDGGREAGPIGQLPAASRFRWLTAQRSTILQTSRVHPGFCTDAAETLEKLYKQLVISE